ncbi:thrombospondin type 3 repeat-containing protein [Methanocella arvoryzae]|uniref:thrombospondin type 3 repeat-containing protein n=1 Tax=Methanocella arvoryzae TaxID=1175445 RepID=UPI00373AF4EC
MYAGDCDNDGISDGDEVLNGTNPQEADSDGDFILSGEEALYGEDPTIFDINSPEVRGEVCYS